MRFDTSRILICRSDNIGDVLLSLPLASLCKQHYPRSEVFYLARSHVHPVLDLSPDVDGVLDSDSLLRQPLGSAAAVVRSGRFDVFINVAGDRRTARLARAAAIPLRIGTSHRWHHWLYCNRLIRMTRARSQRHEVELNLELFRGLARTHEPISLVPRLEKPSPPPPGLARHLDPRRFNLIIHPGSNGNGREWPARRYCELIDALPTERFNLLLTGGDGEEARFGEDLIAPCVGRVTSLVGRLTLAELISLIHAADGLLASGTGPLHLAGALGRHTLGLFPDHPTAGANRWAPQGMHAQHVTAGTPCTRACVGRTCACMDTIDPASVREVLQGFSSQVLPRDGDGHP